MPTSHPNGPKFESPKAPRPARWFVWAVVALVAFNVLLFCQFVILSQSGHSAPKQSTNGPSKVPYEGGKRTVE